METFTVQELEELPAVAKQVLAAIARKQTGTATVLALHGDLGAGKTTFVQVLAKELGIEEVVVSPTFVVMKRYLLPEVVGAAASLHELYHLDAYRIESEVEMEPLRFGEILSMPGALVVIEWAERIKPLLPPHTYHLTFATEGTTRIITLT